MAFIATAERLRGGELNMSRPLSLRTRDVYGKTLGRGSGCDDEAVHVRLCFGHFTLRCWQEEARSHELLFWIAVTSMMLWLDLRLLVSVGRTFEASEIKQSLMGYGKIPRLCHSASQLVHAVTKYSTRLADFQGIRGVSSLCIGPNRH